MIHVIVPVYSKKGNKNEEETNKQDSFTIGKRGPSQVCTWQEYNHINRQLKYIHV